MTVSDLQIRPSEPNLASPDERVRSNPRLQLNRSTSSFRQNQLDVRSGTFETGHQLLQ